MPPSTVPKLIPALRHPQALVVTGRRDWTIRNRPATNAPSVREALAAGLAPEAWKSEKAADWLTKTPPVRFWDRCTPTSTAARSTSSSTLVDVLYTAAVNAPLAPTVSRKIRMLSSVDPVGTAKLTGPKHSVS